MADATPRGPYAHSVWGFVLLLGAALWGFWPPYLSRLLAGPDLPTHVHGLCAFAWVSLLVAQATLMRRGDRARHRRLGRLAWLLGPAFVLSALWLTWARTRAVDGMVEPFRYTLAFVQLGATALFALCLAQALRHRRDAPRHMRWMVATAVTMIDPVIARVATFHLPPLPLADYWGVLIALAVLAVLAWRERAVSAAREVYPTLAALMLLFYAGIAVVGDWSPWRRFVEWFAGA